MCDIPLPCIIAMSLATSHAG